MSTEIEALALLSSEEKETLDLTVTEKNAEADKIRNTLELTQQAITWIEKLDVLQKQIASLEDQVAEIRASEKRGASPALDPGAGKNRIPLSGPIR